MLRLCQSYRAWHLTPPCSLSPFTSTIRCSSSQNAPASQDGEISHNDRQDPYPLFHKKNKGYHQKDGIQLDPVPNYIGALFNRRTQKERSRPWFYDHLNNKQDAHKISIETMRFTSREVEATAHPSDSGVSNDSRRAGKPNVTYISSPGQLNSLFARMRKLGLRIAPNQLIDAMLIAIERPSTLKEYLRLLMTAGTEIEVLSSDESKEASIMERDIQQILQHLKEIDLSGVEQIEIKRLQYLEALTGLEDIGGRGNVQERDSSLLHLVKRMENPCWEEYLAQVYRFGGAEAVTFEWESLRQESSQTITTESALKYERQKDMNKIRNVVVRTLAHQSSSQSAWEIAYEAEDLAKDIEAETWACLLAFPEGIKKWMPEMDEPALVMLTRKITELEDSLGIKWAGGEDGYHIQAEKPFWEAQDEKEELMNLEQREQ